MRSHDLAALAGVTVRTLCHYHHVGVLPEPQRCRNGYRHYTVHHLVRLLRIRRLGELGVPLAQMARVLDTEPQDHVTLLGQVEEDIDAQISRLQQQRALIQLIRTNRAASDLPPELARFVELFAASGVSPAMSRTDRAQAILLAHLLGDSGTQRLAEVYERLAAPGVRASIIGLTRAFDDLPADADDQAITALVDRVVTHIAPLVADLGTTPDDLPADADNATELLTAYQRDALNLAQRTALTRITRRLPQAAHPSRSPA